MFRQRLQLGVKSRFKSQPEWLFCDLKPCRIQQQVPLCPSTHGAAAGVVKEKSLVQVHKWKSLGK